MERSNRVDLRLKEFLSNENLVSMRDRKTRKCLGVAFTEEGLRGLANKNGVYIYCKGRVTNYKEASRSEKSEEVVVEKFIPQDFNKKDLATAEVHWALCARSKLMQQQRFL